MVRYILACYFTFVKTTNFALITDRLDQIRLVLSKSYIASFWYQAEKYYW